MFKDITPDPRVRDIREIAPGEVGEGPTAAPGPAPAAPFDPGPVDATFDFFVELDARTQYFQLYGNTPKYLVMYGKLGVATQKWVALCQAATDQERSAARSALMIELSKPEVTAAVDGLDGMLRELLVTHFTGEPGGLDSDRYLTVVEAFARDVLPVDEDRWNRFHTANPDDTTTAKDDVARHRMDGPFMWFVWASVVDAAALLSSDGGLEDTARAAQLAGCALGSAMDFVFRDPARGKTRPEYRPDAATLNLLRASGRAWASDLTQASTQVRDLCRIFTAN
jgi:hypothetical protein